MNLRNQPGLTLIETLVATGIAVVLLSIAITGIPAATSKTQMLQCLSNMKQLHLATLSMALDSATTGNTNVGWPGDTGGTFSYWSVSLVKNGYLRQDDLCKLLSGPGKLVPTNSVPLVNTNAILVYAVREDSPNETTFLTSGNFTNTPTGGLPLSGDAKPFGNKGFYIFKKYGDGALLSPGAIGKTNQVGLFVPLCR